MTKKLSTMASSQNATTGVPSEQTRLSYEFQQLTRQMAALAAKMGTTVPSSPAFLDDSQGATQGPPFVPLAAPPAAIPPPPSFNPYAALSNTSYRPSLPNRPSGPTIPATKDGSLNLERDVRRRSGRTLWPVNDTTTMPQMSLGPICCGPAYDQPALHMASQAPVSKESDIFPEASEAFAKEYTKPFCDFMTANPTVFHAVESFKKEMKSAGWTELNEREFWPLKAGGRYFVERNGSSLISFVVGRRYSAGNGAAIIAGHVDALSARLKPVSNLPTKAGYVQLGVAPYGGALSSTWWDRDLGIGGRVLVQEGDKIVTKLVKLDWPIARIPTLAPHFGAPANGPFNKETQMVPIIGLDNGTSGAEASESHDFGGAFVNTQPKALVNLIAESLGLAANEVGRIVNWELELFDFQPATVGGINKDFIFAGRIDDKLCSWAAQRALLDGTDADTRASSIIKVVGLFDDEEIGSLLRQGANSNFLPATIERAVNALNNIRCEQAIGQTWANSFLVSADVNHAVNPNFREQYLPNHEPRLNVGLAVAADSNGHMTTDAVSTAILRRCVAKTKSKLQVFQSRNDSRDGGTVGPMLSAKTGMRAVDAGIPQLSMHSIRATTGSLDPGLGIAAFIGFLNGFEAVDAEFRP